MINDQRYNEWLASQPYAPCPRCDEDVECSELEAAGGTCWKCAGREEDESE